MTTILPDSAISSWGGFVYQGKVALYHSIKLLFEKRFNNLPIADFELQLDSTDDFAIYVEGNAVSVHQVKAKSSEYRSTFVSALEKSSAIDTDCSATTVRYFHIANKINDASEYTNSAGAKVLFYDYSGDSYCRLSDIEAKTKEHIDGYLVLHGCPCTPTLIDRKYCYLSELITRQVIKEHSYIHAGEKENVVAYRERIPSKVLIEILTTDYHAVDDKEYKLQKLKATFAEAFENYIAVGISAFTAKQVKLSDEVFRFIYGMVPADLTSVMHSLRPASPNDDIRFDDIQNYADIITEISSTLVLNGLPHYSKNVRRYLPTALLLTERRVPTFKEGLIAQIRSNQNLANVLFEYNTLITMADVKNIAIVGRSEKITCAPYADPKVGENIVREFPVSIISKDVAEGELNA